MLISRISISNFRNYANLDLELHPELNIITGPNAQGKTNLLEAIYFNLKGFSFRAHSDKEIIKWQEKFSFVKGNIKKSTEKNDDSWVNKVVINQQGQKKFFINDVEKKRKELPQTGVVLFTPDDLSIIKGSPTMRRKFLDQEVGSFHENYLQEYQKFIQVLNHRNRLLKEVRLRREDSAMLEIWDQQLVEHGSRILLRRLEILKKLVPLVKKWYSYIAMDQESLQIKYLSSLKLNLPIKENNLHEYFHQVLKNLKKEELARCQTLVGPHRDDLSFFINDKDAKNYASQGQQRTIVLSLKLAQVSLWTEAYNLKPILILDDVLFELDENRQKMLLSFIKNGIQTFITTNHFNGKLPENGYKIFRVEKGVIF